MNTKIGSKLKTNEGTSKLQDFMTEKLNEEIQVLEAENEEL